MSPDDCTCYKYTGWLKVLYKESNLFLIMSEACWEMTRTSKLNKPDQEVDKRQFTTENISVWWISLPPFLI